MNTLDRFDIISNSCSICVIVFLAILLVLSSINIKPISLETNKVVSVSIEYIQSAVIEEPITPMIEESVIPDVIQETVVKPKVQPKPKSVVKQTKKPVTATDEAATPQSITDMPVNLSNNDNFMNLFLQKIQNSLYYPKNARRAGITGIVEVKVTFSASGEIIRTEPTGDYHPTLGDAALTTMKKVQESWQPILAPNKEQTVIIPIAFELK